MSDPDIVARLRDCTCVPHGEICREAADEIERLREALRIEHEELAACCIDRKETQRERDEARREVCNLLWQKWNGSETEIAAQRGWDCFKTCRYCCTEDSFMTDRDRGMCGTCQRERHDDGP